MFKSFLIALSFFTRIPIKLKKEISSEEFFKSMLTMPFVGFVIGGILYLIASILSPIPNNELKSIVLLVCFIILTGGLHLDGLADTADAIFSARDRERMLEILKDSHLGTFGAVTLILLLLAYFAAFSYVFELNSFYCLILMPVVGRYGAIQLGAFAKPVPTGGLGESFCKVDKPSIAIIYIILISGILILLQAYLYLTCYLITILLSLLYIPYFTRLLGGITGDQFGFCIETSQILFLFTFLILQIYWSF